jgi:hypothetical protein
MAIDFKYAMPVDQTDWLVSGKTSTAFRWDYDASHEGLLRLYDKGKKQQWDAKDRIDWNQDLDPENPVGLPDESIGIFGSDIWNKLTPKERMNLRRHAQAYFISQFLHGEQGALVCAAKIVQEVPDLTSKLYAATQTIDEARHVEAYSRLLREKFELAYPVTAPLKVLLENVISDSRWDFTHLGMQVLIEGLALASFQRLRDQAGNQLVASINAYVMQDEARHVAFGRIALRNYYPQLTQKERDEREEFVVESCYHMRDRFHSSEIWDTVGLPAKECIEITINAPSTRYVLSRLFSRIVPTIKDIGLWGKKVQKAFGDMGVLELADLNIEEISEHDNRIAQEFDARRLELNENAAVAKQSTS